MTLIVLILIGLALFGFGFACIYIDWLVRVSENKYQNECKQKVIEENREHMEKMNNI